MLADITATHEREIGEVEAGLNQVIGQYRTALEGSDPERAAQLTEFAQTMQASDRELSQAREALAAERARSADLEARLAELSRLNEEAEQELSGFGRKLEGLQAELAGEREALQALRSEYEKLEADADAASSQLESRLAAAEAALEQAQREAAAELAAVVEKDAEILEQTKKEDDALLRKEQEEHASKMAAAESEITRLTEELRTERDALAALQEEHEQLTADLNRSLADAEGALAGANEELERVTGALDEGQGRIAALEEELERTRAEAQRELEDARAAGAESLARQRKLFARYSDLGGRQSDGGILLTLGDETLRFGSGSAALPDGDLPSLDEIAKLLSNFPGLSARIEGHTDALGSDETNLALSQQRADAVRAALVERGIAEGRLTAEGIGEAKPVADNDSASGRSQNRRVEIYVLEE